MALAAEPDPHTTVSKPEVAVETHVADSLAALDLPAPHGATRIADIGAGPGFPGLVLAIALPQAEVDLIESSRRKRDVAERLATAAGVTNARPIAARVEDWARSGEQGREAYDVAAARAVAPLAVLVEYAAPLLRPGGTFVAWKGARDAAEEGAGARAADQVGLSLTEVRPVQPFPDAEHRHLHVYSKVRPTPERFPRRSGMARKRPLA